MLTVSVGRYSFNRCLKDTRSAPFNYISRTKIWRLTEPEDGLVPARLLFIDPDIHRHEQQKKLSDSQLMSQKNVTLFSGL